MSEAFCADEAVSAYKAYDAVPNNEPVNEVAITDPVILNVLPL